MATDTVHDGRTAVEDERLAAASSAKVLISTTTPSAVEVIAHRIHQSSGRAHRPFITLNAGDLSADRRALRAECTQLRAAARGGSVLLKDVERMSRTVQDLIIEVLDEVEAAHPHEGFRLFSGTSVALFDRVVAGTFSEQLFYHLNVLHLHGRDR